MKTLIIFNIKNYFRGSFLVDYISSLIVASKASSKVVYIQYSVLLSSSTCGISIWFFLKKNLIQTYLSKVLEVYFWS